MQWKTSTGFVFEFRYVIMDQLYDKCSITKAIELNISDRLQNKRFIRDQRAKSRVCVFAGYPKNWKMRNRNWKLENPIFLLLYSSVTSTYL